MPESSVDPLLGQSESKWSAIAEADLVEALEQVRDGEDAILTIEHALAALRIEAGELPEDELDDAGPLCICTPEQLARGGFKGGCRVHGA